MVTDGGPGLDGTPDRRSVDKRVYPLLDGPIGTMATISPAAGDTSQPYPVLVMDASSTPSTSLSSEGRSALFRRRERLRARLGEMEHEFRSMVEASAGSNADDEHDPEGATIAFERAQLGALIDGARRHLAEMDAALARWAAGCYGVCERCAEPIGELRLTARPAARVCISCAEH